MVTNMTEKLNIFYTFRKETDYLTETRTFYFLYLATYSHYDKIHIISLVSNFILCMLQSGWATT